MLRIRSGPILNLTGICARYFKSRARRTPFDRQADDVVPGDLAATLEAHRESNAALKVRRAGAADWKYSEEYVKPYKPPQETSQETGDKAAVAAREHVHEKGVVVESPGQHGGSRRNRRIIPRALRQELLKTGVYVPPHTFKDTSVFKPYLPQDYADLGVEVKELMTLDYSINTFSNWISLSPAELEARRFISQAFCSVLSGLCPSLRFNLYGSNVTDLATPTSDINIAFSLRPGPAEVNVDSVDDILDERLAERGFNRSIRLSVDQIEKHSAELFQSGFRFERKWFTDGKPMAEVYHEPTGTLLQLAYIDNPGRFTSHVKSSLHQLPRLRPLYQVTRSALDVRGLLGRYNKGLSSYALFALLSSYLNTAPAGSRLGQDLLGFLKFVSQLNTSQYCVASEPPFVREKLKRAELGNADNFQIRDDARPYLLGLQDPITTADDLTRHAFRIMDIRATFHVLAGKLHTGMLRHTKTTDKVADPLSGFFGGMLGYVRDKRRGFNLDFSRWDSGYR